MRIPAKLVYYKGKSYSGTVDIDIIPQNDGIWSFFKFIFCHSLKTFFLFCSYHLYIAAKNIPIDHIAGLTFSSPTSVTSCCQYQTCTLNEMIKE